VSTVLFVALFVVVLTGVALASRWLVTHSERLWNLAGRGLRRMAASGIVTRARKRYPRVWRLFADRLSPQHYLGLHLTLGLAVSVSALMLFAAVADEIHDREALALLDAAILELLRVYEVRSMTRAFGLISDAGSGIAILSLGLTGAAGLAFARRWSLLTGWLAAFLGAAFLNASLKALFQRPRPAGAAELLQSASWSFPSGHALTSLVGYGMVAYLAVLHVRSPALRTVIIVLAIVLVSAIGVSRLYLGVHYFTDVIGGYAAGAVWLSVCVSGLEIARRRTSRSSRRSLPTSIDGS
jgi:undecaprenyl-diphosphatase